jgi:hypothetical protein
VQEALRMKKELAQAVMFCMRTPVTHGKQVEKGQGDAASPVVSEPDPDLALMEGLGSYDTGPQTPFPEFMKKFDNVLKMSETLNSILAGYSVTSGISDSVRRKANIELKITHYTSALSQAVQTTHTRHEIVGNVRVPIVTVFTPFMTKMQIKDQIKSLKAEKNAILAKIDLANNQQIELPFSKEEFDDVTSN